MQSPTWLRRTQRPLSAVTAALVLAVPLVGTGEDPHGGATSDAEQRLRAVEGCGIHRPPMAADDLV